MSDPRMETLRLKMQYELLVTEECFQRCVHTLASKTLIPSEEACIKVCAQKYADAKKPLTSKYFNKFVQNFVPPKATSKESQNHNT